MKFRLTFFFAFFLILSNIVSAQDPLSTYKSDYWQKSFDVDISFDDDSVFTLWIDAVSLDSFSKQVGVSVEEEESYQDFLSSFQGAFEKYKEWVEVAKSNNVTELTKKMEYKCTVEAFFQYGSEWHFDRYVNLYFIFLIHEIEGELNYTLTVSTGELQSSSNQFMKIDGLSLAFNNAKDIEGFLDAISVKTIEKFKTEPKKEDLFK